MIIKVNNKDIDFHIRFSGISERKKFGGSSKEYTASFTIWTNQDTLSVYEQEKIVNFIETSVNSK
jgi:hypothetical protein